MKESINLLHEARELLEEAEKQDAGLGTELMIRDVRRDLESLIESSEEIHEQ